MQFRDGEVDDKTGDQHATQELWQALEEGARANDAAHHSGVQLLHAANRRGHKSSRDRTQEAEAALEMGIL